MHTATPFMHSLAIQSRVIGALLMREILTRYGRHNIGFLWLFAEPMIFTLGITLIWNAVGATHGSTLPITAFAVTGYSTVMVWRNTVNRCVLAITPNLSLMYHRNVRVIDVFAARIILEESGATISFIVLTIFFSSVSWMEPPDDIAEVLFGWFLMLWFGGSLGILVGSITERSDVVEKLWHPIAYFMFPFSGAAFMMEWLPPSAREMAQWVPMVHCVEIIREGFFGSSVHPYYNVGYISTFCLCQTFLGLALVRETGRRLEPE